jgi:hypothetical protein
MSFYCGRIAACASTLHGPMRTRQLLSWSPFAKLCRRETKFAVFQD